MQPGKKGDISHVIPAKVHTAIQASVWTDPNGQESYECHKDEMCTNYR